MKVRDCYLLLLTLAFVVISVSTARAMAELCVNVDANPGDNGGDPCPFIADPSGIEVPEGVKIGEIELEVCGGTIYCPGNASSVASAITIHATDENWVDFPTYARNFTYTINNAPITTLPPGQYNVKVTFEVPGCHLQWAIFGSYKTVSATVLVTVSTEILPGAQACACQPGANWQPYTAVSAPSFVGIELDGHAETEIYAGFDYLLKSARGSDYDAIRPNPDVPYSCITQDAMSPAYPRWFCSEGYFPSGDRGQNVVYRPPKDKDSVYFTIEENDLPLLIDDPPSLYSIETTDFVPIHFPSYLTLTPSGSTFTQTNAGGCSVGVLRTFTWTIMDNYSGIYTVPKSAPKTTELNTSVCIDNCPAAGSGGTAIQDKTVYVNPFSDRIGWVYGPINSPYSNNHPVVSLAPCVGNDCGDGVVWVKTQSIKTAYGMYTWDLSYLNAQQWHIYSCVKSLGGGGECMGVDYSVAPVSCQDNFCFNCY